MSNIKLKFRPSLTLEQINYILNLLPKESPIAKEISRSLTPFKLKAEAGIIYPSHVSTGKQSIGDSLGFSEQSSDTIESLMQVWETSPASLSPAQVAKVQHHRYINDMMTPEEEQAYEKG